jgi:hypothetical protein
VKRKVDGHYASSFDQQRRTQHHAIFSDQAHLSHAGVVSRSDIDHRLERPREFKSRINAEISRDAPYMDLRAVRIERDCATSATLEEQPPLVGSESVP